MPELNKQAALDFVKRHFNVAKKANSLDFERFARYYRLFRNKQTIQNYRGLANLFVPEPYRIVRKKTAKLANAIRHVTVESDHPQFEQAAQMGEHLLNYIRRKLNWDMVKRTAIQESRIVGLAWLKLTWNADKETQEKPWKGFDLNFIPVDQVFLNPEATMQDVFGGNVNWLIHYYETDINTVKADPRNDQQEIKQLEMRGGGPKTDRTNLEMARFQWLQQKNVRDTLTKRVRIMEFWGKFNPQDPDGLKQTGEVEDYFIRIADSTAVLRMEVNPYKEVLENPLPFVPICANPVGEELYPIGDIEPAESLFNELNDTRNQRMDTVTLNIDPAKEILKGAGIDEKDLVARRGWVIRSNIPNGVRFIPPDMQGVKAAMDEEQAIRGDIAQVTGILDLTPGTEVQSGVAIDTAKGALIAKNEADLLTEDEVSVLQMSMRMLYKIALSYAQKFLDKPFSMRVVENGTPQFFQVDKQSLQGNLDLDVEMKTLQDETTEQQMSLLLLNQARETPGAQMSKFFTDTILLFKDKDNININEYYQPPQPPPPTPPSVSISLKGDLNPIEADEVFMTIPGVNKAAADPMIRPEGREMMRGRLPEHHEAKVKEAELANTEADTKSKLAPKPSA